MKTRFAACSAALLLAACGCTTPQAITRSQSPHHETTNIVPASYGNLATIQNSFHDAHAYSSSYHSVSGFPGYDATLGPAGAYGPGGACGYGGCGCGQGGACGCGAGCGCGHGCPHHCHSFAYSRPHDLVYPPPNAPGGAIVYPYYTHKGPSDFFRDDDSCRCSR